MDLLVFCMILLFSICLKLIPLGKLRTQAKKKKKNIDHRSFYTPFNLASYDYNLSIFEKRFESLTRNIRFNSTEKIYSSGQYAYWKN